MRIRVDPLDTLFSQYIRLKAKGICARCGQYKGFKGLQASHFHGRAKKSVRYDEDNCCALCFGCHQYLGSHPFEHIEFFKQRLGEQAFDLLMTRTRNVGKPDKKLIEIYLKAEIKKLIEKDN